MVGSDRDDLVRAYRRAPAADDDP
ncbi:MAG: hypothetical protein QOG22_2128, partial [Pseudonocardiales bacterium]|nr:hypothetical protein [Pseudonocardiales bacterium]